MSTNIKSIYDGINICRGLTGILPLIEALPMNLMYIKMLSTKEITTLVNSSKKIIPHIKIINDEFRINKLFNLPSVAIKQEYI